MLSVVSPTGLVLPWLQIVNMHEVCLGSRGARCKIKKGARSKKSESEPYAKIPTWARSKNPKVSPVQKSQSEPEAKTTEVSPMQKSRNGPEAKNPKVSPMHKSRSEATTIEARKSRKYRRA